MRPAWTQADPTPTAPIVSTVQARNWVGLYGDSSLDAELAVCVEAAIEKVASFLDYRIEDTAIMDFYPAASDRALELSEPGIAEASVAVKIYDRDGAEQTLADDAWSLDPTAERNTVILAAVPQLSADYRYPLRVEYTSSLEHVRGPAVAGRIRAGVRMALAWSWRTRGEPADPHLLDKSLTSMLAGARIEPAVAA